MAIIKRAKNSIVEVNKKNVVIAKEIEKTAETITLEATYGDLEINSANKIIINGNIN
ncbi:hypothetical protein [Flavobacterium hercynium]|uniref:hypothetical protein n=1 Tax=Flavobacterium hercynium TaxID=387094 RepID=UPI0013FD4331|nr:hypothetical protein [Flavobacterium hercynium]SMP13175.1 hypothetical protein SAMN06265346_103307 [Flavobacterium hercynium]